MKSPPSFIGLARNSPSLEIEFHSLICNPMLVVVRFPHLQPQGFG